ncbi:hybrid sensor histidine kinase/response regulator [Brunnivagina elsteri]|uniref:histidine kinase n=1 Tax=Brunnivagina elsteri CCALA 953 TaxID=987040 RepID=A0A2A2TI68_9CYAN|nr:response regulator [Calothrix elsteri]PAX53099.1 hybrid sensor histidine kinase/response regulator [Calothrix elsteri CCALA 953]
MITDESIREQGYMYFLTEAPELLQTIEEELYGLSDNFSIGKVHNLMRATHTIKGGAANVGLDIINKIAHSLEDIFKALYNPEVEIDTHLQTLLFQAFECLQLPVTAETTKTSIDDDDLLQRAASVFAQLQDKLGDAFGAEFHIPTSQELGFDIVLSIFETGVSQRIDNIAHMLESPPDNDEIASFMRSQAEIFVGLAESLNLQGFEEIAHTIIAALDANPQQALTVAQASLVSLEGSRQAVLNGDRIRGGEPHEELLKLTQPILSLGINLKEDISSEDIYDKPLTFSSNYPAATSVEDSTMGFMEDMVKNIAENIPNSPSIDSLSLRSEVEELYNFLRTPNSILRKPLKSQIAKHYLKIIRYILGWFNHELEIPEKELSLSLLVPKISVESTVDYIDNWLGELWLFLDNDSDSPSLSLYRQGVILNVLLLIAKFKYANQLGDSPVIESLQDQIKKLTKEYKNYPPITDIEKNWIDNPRLQKLLEVKPISVHKPVEIAINEGGIEAIWGEDISATLAEVGGINYIQEAANNDVKGASSTIVNVAPNHLLETKSPQNNQIQQNESVTIIEQKVINKVAQEIAEKTIEATIEATTIQTSQINKPSEAKTQLNPNTNTNTNTSNLRQRSFVRVDVEGLQRLNYLAGELLIYQKRRTLQDEQIHELVEQLSRNLTRHQATLDNLRDLPLQTQNFSFHSHKNVASVDFDSLEMDEYSEFYLTLHSAFEETLQLQEIAESLDLILRQSAHIHDTKQNLTLNIIDNLVEARMSPLGNILNRFPQMVTNMANVYGKNVVMKLTGTQVLVDKAISEKLYDPLLHIVRNAFDHGIEAPEIRQQRGKTETGTIEIRAYHQGSQTIIEVGDDGQGLNFEKIHQKGIEQGLIPNAYHPSEDELLELLFSPGFSTAGKVSEISGRGIGLDIVKTQLKALNGSIAIRSIPNEGTTFVLKLPFSMTTDKLMIVQAGGAIYALLLDSIEKIILPSNEQIKGFEGRKVLHWNTDKDERMIGLRNLSELMYYNGSFVSGTGLNNNTVVYDNQEMANPVLVLRRNQEIIALEVDQILGEQELVIRPLGSAIAPPKYVYGCTSMANGNLILVIDGSLLIETTELQQASLDVGVLPASSAIKKKALPMSFASTSTPLLSSSDFEDNQKDTRTLLAPAIENTYKSTKTILVVDDAISLRQTISLTLQKAGYQVVQAQHGIEAIEQLQRHPEIQMIVSDLEMPRMNGFELLSNIRQNPSLSKKPVIILTSRSADKHRKLAEGLGANSYMTKPYLEHEFLGIIDALLNKQAETSSQIFAKL